MNRQFFIVFFLLALIHNGGICQSHISTQPHGNSVSAIAPLGTGDFFSAGDDGFLIKWSMNDNMGEHYQVSDIAIKMISCSPVGDDIAVYETNGSSINKISVWNWKKLTRKYTVNFETDITSLSYSQKGTYIMIGCQSANSIVFLNSANGRPVSKIKENTGPSSFAATSSTEKSAIIYKQNGELLYYNLQTGKQKQKFTTLQSIKQMTLFHNNLFLAGTNGDAVCVVKAIGGKTLTRQHAASPFIISSKDDTDLYYVTNDGTQCSLLCMKVLNSSSLSDPVVLKTFSLPDARSKITSAAKTDGYLVLGTSNGTLLSVNLSPDASIETYAASITRNIYDRIIDVASRGDSFYFLTASSLFKSEYDSSYIVKIASNPGCTDILPSDDILILWSKNKKNSVYMYDIYEEKTTKIFSPSKPVKSLRLFRDTLSILEGNTAVKSLSLNTLEAKTVYTGNSIEDIAVYNENSLYVARSMATKTESALMHIDTKTKETVAMPVSGTVAFSLVYDNENYHPLLYGIKIYNSAERESTVLFSFNMQTKAESQIIQMNGEDTRALISLSIPYLYTNLGKNQIRSYNLLTKKSIVYKRSASIPVKAAGGLSYLAVLNSDGSVSLYNPDKASVIADWYLTRNGQLVEF